MFCVMLVEQAKHLETEMTKFRDQHQVSLLPLEPLYKCVYWQLSAEVSMLLIDELENLEPRFKRRITRIVNSEW